MPASGLPAGAGRDRVLALEAEARAALPSSRRGTPLGLADEDTGVAGLFVAFALFAVVVVMVVIGAVTTVRWLV